MLDIAEKLAVILKETEFFCRTYIVGGAVRDLLRGVESDDIDIVVEMEEGGIKLAEFLYKADIVLSRLSLKGFPQLLS